MALTTIKLAAIIGIAIVLFAVSLLVIHVPPRTIAILFGIGGTLTAIYLYIEHNQNKPAPLKSMCKCNVCDHKNEITCLEDKCGCCTIEKDGRYEHGVSTLT